MMQTTQEQHGSYKQNYGSNGSRETDMRALLKYAGLLQEALADGGKNVKAYQEAIRENQRLWTIFQVAISDPDNPLPDHVKAQLLYVSRHIDKASFAAIARFNPDALVTLINLNRTIAKGLAQKPAVTQPQQGQAPAQQPDAPLVKSLMISA